jgi:hypothetical protein
MLIRRPVLAGPTRAGSKPLLSSETVTISPPHWLRRAVNTAARTPARAARFAEPPGGGVERLGRSQRNVQVASYVQLGRGLDRATQRGPQVGQAVAFEGHLPGQRSELCGP